MQIRERVSMSGYTTFKVGGEARFFAEAEQESEVVEAWRWAKEHGVPLFVLGGGSNLLVADSGFDGLVLRLAIRGVERDGSRFDVGAGESWDELVDRTVAAECAGMECLAGIPGSVGATPVQNVGAYGQDVAETIASVRALDRGTGDFMEFSGEECRFRYRKSVFNTEQRDRFLITRVRFALRPGGDPELRYADLQRHFARAEKTPHLAEVATVVRSIRRNKGMVLTPGDPDTQSAGSYFKNPMIPTTQVQGIAAAAQVEPAAVPVYPADEGWKKLSAAWLVERAGFERGFRLGAAGISTRHTLALTNRGGATCADILRLEQHVREGVAERFKVILEREPVLLGTVPKLL
ncbi:MAG: UDP-N-acetylmuramate dehydrogenase [Janthinobacterium lividum]